jgi:PHD/YefM family antitoxin component YafN of YafNO toxin-antitoxin module
MKITQTRVKQYNSTYKTVITVDGIPVCITRSNKRASDIISYLSGYDVEINDGKLKKQLDKIRVKEQ